MPPSCRAPRAQTCRSLEGIDDGMVAGATAVIAGKMLAYPCPVRLGVWLQQLLGRHQHARSAIAALQRVTLPKRCLQVGNLATVGKAFDGLDGCTMRLHCQHKAGTHDIVVDANRACAANPVLTADMRP